MLKYESGEVFATGSVQYLYAPPESPKLQLEVEVEATVRLHAVVDTAAPYFILDPKFSADLNLSALDDIGTVKISTRKGLIDGKLYRLTIELLATAGNSLELEATTFVPDDDQWNGEPSFLGLANCLDRLRFAIDPGTETFFFGSF